MMVDFHLLRPWWLLMLIPVTGLVFVVWRQKPRLHAWLDVCDPHLLDHLLQKKGQTKRARSLLLLFGSLFFMTLSLSGPTWYQYPVATYKPVLPRVLVLDLSESMMENDLSPNRLSRAKFKLQDLLARKGLGQFGLVVFTGEPFVVSPLTDDGQTIVSLLPMLTPDIMPVTGQNLESALTEASRLIQQAGYQQGELLVFSAVSPSMKSIETAKALAEKGIYTSIMPMKAEKDLNPLFQHLARSGGGQLLVYSSDATDLEAWIKGSMQKKEVMLDQHNDIPLWRDEGRWFLIPALLFLLPIFQRGWLQRVDV